MMQMSTRPASAQAHELLFDWKVDVERLEKEARRAVDRQQTDPWTRFEAECSLDLIDVEIAALRPKGSQGRVAAPSLAQLGGWRRRIERVIRTLRSLPEDEVR